MADTPAPAASKTLEQQFAGHDAVARVYAKALIGAAGNELSSVLAELDSFLDEVIPRSPHLYAVMTSGMVSSDAKLQLIDKVFTGRSSKLFISFLKVIAEHGRGDCLPTLRRVVRELMEQASGHVRIQVQSALPLDEAATKRLSDRLRELIHAEPILETSLKPELLGGVVLRIGDTVYDGSVSSQLEQLRTQLLNRSVHEV